MISKDFLLQECKNVRILLDSSLRFDYGPEGSHEFYYECDTRLEFIKDEIENALDLFTLEKNGILLNELSKLICRIERSSLGEYSWPFVEELKQIASKICVENTSKGEVAPKVFVLADGGLEAYAINPELARPSSAIQRLLTIVFPKSLKHYVLLHSILGHELGHAIWRCSKHQKEIITNVFTPLARAGGILSSQAATTAHLFDATAPAPIQSALARLKSSPNL
jgi:hypothetical protein